MKAAVRSLLALSAPVAACPWHGDIFGDESGGYLSEPVAGGAADPQPAQPALSREELMAKQRELFLARYPQLAAGSGDKPAPAAAPSAPPAGN
jgi:hypothetical protein